NLLELPRACVRQERRPAPERDGLLVRRPEVLPVPSRCGHADPEAESAMTRGLVIALVVAMAPEAGAAKKVAPKTAERAPSELAARVAGQGKVRFVTAKRAYLDRGALDGLKVGDAISLQRLGKNVGGCKLESVAEREATCAATN